MKGNLPAVVGLLFLLVLPVVAGHKKEIIKIGPIVAIGNYGELSDASLVADGALGIGLAIPCSNRVEIWGSYKFNKKTTPPGMVMYRHFPPGRLCRGPSL